MGEPAAAAAISVAAIPDRLDRNIATTGLMIAVAMQAADALIANVALPHIEADLGGGALMGAWVITAYLCATAVLAPLTGWLRRRYGARRLFPGAIGLFVAASLGCSLAPNAGLLILFRVLQGAGGGVMHPLSQAILLDIHPKERHGRMLALWGAAAMLGPVLGPVIGGAITDLASWRWVFAINLPLGALSVWCLRRARTRAEGDRDLSIDGIGIVMLILGVGALQLCLQHGIGRSWLKSPELIAEAAITVFAFAFLLLRARRTRFAVVRGAVFRDVNFATATFYNFMLSALLFVSVLFVPLLGEGPLGLPATLAGAMVVPRALLMMVMMLGMGQIINRVDMRILLASGWLLMAAGLAILSALQPERGIVWVLVGSTVQAAGAGMLYTPLSTLAFSTLPVELRTDAAGLFSLLRQLGYASGVAVMTAVLRLRVAAQLAHFAAARGGSHGPVSRSLANLATIHAYRDCFAMMSLTAVLVIPGIYLFRTVRRGPAAA
ncbi:MAG TPA: DHA2 family efflux MFS transporter permease subunit [Stellaceae bacterium]|nr:DHA2 family efflux MFS transporter permease subunit [Stellaceae bacterium]